MESPQYPSPKMAKKTILHEQKNITKISYVLHVCFDCWLLMTAPIMGFTVALINGDNEETYGYIHKKNRVKCKSLSSWVDS